MKDLFKKNKKAFLIGGVLVLGGLAWYLFKTRKIPYYDNVWCEDDDCSNINAQSYRSNPRSEGDGTGNLNLLFKEKHGLVEGEEIYIQQDGNPTYPYYNGKTNVTKVYSPYLIRTDKARQGSSPVEGGVVLTKSIASKYFN